MNRKLLAAILFAGTALTAPSVVAQPNQAALSAYSDVDPLTFEAAIRKAHSDGYTIAQIREGFRQNGWSIQDAAIIGILNGTLTAQQAIEQGWITAGVTPDDGAGNGQTGGGYSGGGGSGGNGVSVGA